MFTCGPTLFKPASTVVTAPYMVYDTFTGSGLLSNHLGETGTPWTASANTYSLSGGLVCPVASIGTPTYATGSSTFLDGYVEVQVSNGPDYPLPNAVLFSHFEGTNGSTTFIDNSPRAQTLNGFGGASLSTSKKKFGSTSLFLNGVTDYVETNTYTGASLTGTDPFCMECFVYFLDSGTYKSIMQLTQAGSPDNVWFIGRQITTNYLYAWVGNGVASVYAIIGTTAMAANTWHHVALTRDSTSMKLWLNGGLEGQWSGTGAGFLNWNQPFTLKTVMLGTYDRATNMLYGHMDEVRVVFGQSIYTVPFTPPTVPFTG